MRKILSFIFMILTISVMVFSEEMPKEVRYPSDKLSLTAANELLYDGQLYTGKILLGEKGYINLTNGDLDGETFFENIDTKYNDFKILKEEFNIC